MRDVSAVTPAMPSLSDDENITRPDGAGDGRYNLRIHQLQMMILKNNIPLHRRTM